MEGTQTQELNKEISDIFGDSDDDDDVPQPTQKPTSSTSKDYTDVFGDSDEDDEPAQPVSRRQNKEVQKEVNEIFGDSDEDDDVDVGTSKAKGSKLADNIIDSDDDDAYQNLPSAKDSKKKRKAKEVKIGKKGGKLKRSKTSNPESSSSKGKEKDVSSGDEYDSGDDLQATNEDRNFIDADGDDHADLLKEYDEDNQDFYDERPDDYRGFKSKKSSTSKQRSDDRVSTGPRETDPLSLTLADMKKPKAKEMTDSEKDAFIEKLKRRMVKAVAQDNDCFERKEPAIFKVEMLATLKTAMSMKAMQQMMLDKDILCYLRDWIEPRDANHLPALSVRTAVYEILLKLPCAPEHLKRTINEKPPIGQAIVTLRRHKNETPANKRILKELMEKWSRPIFGKHSEERGRAASDITAMYQNSAEIQSSIREQHAKKRAEASVEAKSRAGSSSNGVDLGEIINGKRVAKEATNSQFHRARTPYSSGFLYTAQPEYKDLDKRDVREKQLGEGRHKLLQSMTGRGNAQPLGKRATTRAITMKI